jgi:hypothetical protein
MTPERQKALEAVAAAARQVACAPNVAGLLIDALRHKLDALDALPPDPATAGEVRKIVSMVTGRDADDVCLEYAICSDGTAWLLQWGKTTPIGWTPLPPIPTTTRLPLTEGGV